MRGWMVMMFVLVCMASLPAFAQQKASHPTLRSAIDLIQVTTMVSKIDETKPEFLSRAAGLMEAYTLATGFEVCSNIYEGNGRIGLFITTNNSHIGCVTALRPPMQMNNTGETIHTHPTSPQIRLNKNDEILSHFHHKRNALFRPNPHVFSDTDYQNGAGYLVIHGKIKYQQGVGTMQTVMEITPPDQKVLASILP